MSQINKLENIVFFYDKCRLPIKKRNVNKYTKNPHINLIKKKENIRLYLLLLIHSTNCKKCNSINCKNMKGYIKHFNECECDKNTCLTYLRVKNMLYYHAKECTKNNCNVIECKNIKNTNNY